MFTPNFQTNLNPQKRLLNVKFLHQISNQIEPQKKIGIIVVFAFEFELICIIVAGMHFLKLFPIKMFYKGI